MEYIKAISLTNARVGFLASTESQKSLAQMKTKTACNSVILIISALQETAHSDELDYTHQYMPSDEELTRTIKFAQEEGLRVILKPVVNCKDGTWRAHINFFDYSPKCEPKWSMWFENYKEYILHYANIAERTGCEMFIVGCELVQTQRKEREWRELIKSVRSIYTGLISYNTDKYSEEHVSWWDAVDVISSSGYYPIDDWDQELNRIEKVAKIFNKPFFFAELGCKSCVSSSQRPNVWELQSKVDVDEQARYYKTMLQVCSKYPFVNGIGIWEWSDCLYEESQGINDRGYNIYGKPASKVLQQIWGNS